MFDSTCKFLVESFSSDFATWLLGEPITLTEISPSELSLEPIRADALILYETDDLILHLEFQTDPKANIPFRVTDYRLRGHRRYPGKRMQQTVIYLRQTNSDLVYQTTFRLERTIHEFDVIRLWEQPTDIFLQSPGLLPLAVLTQASNRAEVLQQVADQIAGLANRSAQAEVAASAFILAGLVLKQDVIQRILREDMMKESVTYQAIQAETTEQNMRQVALTLLHEGVALETIARATQLSIAQIQQLQATGSELPAS
jgi:predicted transposase/invertase (TIGR01784 family)